MSSEAAATEASVAARRRPMVLVVDDDADFRTNLEALVRREGFETCTAASLAEARERIAEALPDLVLVDIELPDGRGVALLAEDDPQVAGEPEYVVVTGNATVESAVAAMREGALDYLTKPVDRPRLQSVLANVARTQRLKGDLQELRDELRKLGRFGRLVGRSEAIQDVYNLIGRVAPTNASVMVIGESGTGKELVAETLHALSRRRDRPLVAVNCGAVAPNLIESELFGHEKGSFTGAARRRAGYFEQASGGTVFLDEITEMPIELQVKLLRVLETSRFFRVGGTDPIETDVRIVAATNRDPAEAVAVGDLREDLYYRLNVFPITLPPLRERGDDIELLAQHFLDELNEEEGSAKRWAPSGLEALRRRSWPGNVRELRNAVQRAFILADDEIGDETLLLLTPRGEAGSTQHGILEVPVGTEIAAIEKRLILATLEHFGGDKKKTAQTLGVSLKTLYNRLNVYRAEGDAS